MGDPAVTDLRITNLESAVSDIRQAVRSIDSSLRVLARLEDRHEEVNKSLARAFVQNEQLEERIRMLEMEAPLTRMVRGWVISGVIGVVSIVSVAAYKLPR